MTSLELPIRKGRRMGIAQAAAVRVLQELKGQIRVPTDYFAPLRICEDSVQVQNRVVCRNEKVGIKCNCSCRMKRISGANATGLKIELLHLKADGPGRQV